MENSKTAPKSYGEKQIGRHKFYSIGLAILGLILLGLLILLAIASSKAQGMAMVSLPGVFTCVLVFYYSFKNSRKASSLKKRLRFTSPPSGKHSEFIPQLQFAISCQDHERVDSLLTDYITNENFDEVNSDYESEYLEDITKALSKSSRQYTRIAEFLSVLIDKGILESTYPHERIK